MNPTVPAPRSRVRKTFKTPQLHTPVGAAVPSPDDDQGSQTAPRSPLRRPRPVTNPRRSRDQRRPRPPPSRPAFVPNLNISLPHKQAGEVFDRRGPHHNPSTTTSLRGPRRSKTEPARKGWRFTPLQRIPNPGRSPGVNPGRHYRDSLATPSMQSPRFARAITHPVDDRRRGLLRVAQRILSPKNDAHLRRKRTIKCGGP